MSDDAGRATEFAITVRGVLASIALAWYFTALAVFWFVLQNNMFMVLIWLAIQFGLLITLTVFGWGHLVQLWTGAKPHDQSPVYLVIFMMAAGVPIVWFAHVYLTYS